MAQWLGALTDLALLYNYACQLSFFPDFLFLQTYFSLTLATCPWIKMQQQADENKARTAITSSLIACRAFRVKNTFPRKQWKCVKRSLACQMRRNKQRGLQLNKWCISCSYYSKGSRKRTQTIPAVILVDRNTSRYIRGNYLPIIFDWQEMLYAFMTIQDFYSLLQKSDLYSNNSWKLHPLEKKVYYYKHFRKLRYDEERIILSIMCRRQTWWKCGQRCCTAPWNQTMLPKYIFCFILT